MEYYGRSLNVTYRTRAEGVQVPADVPARASRAKVLTGDAGRRAAVPTVSRSCWLLLTAPRSPGGRAICCGSQKAAGQGRQHGLHRAWRRRAASCQPPACRPSRSVNSDCTGAEPLPDQPGQRGQRGGLRRGVRPSGPAPPAPRSLDLGAGATPPISPLKDTDTPHRPTVRVGGQIRERRAILPVTTRRRICSARPGSITPKSAQG